MFCFIIIQVCSVPWWWTQLLVSRRLVRGTVHGQLRLLPLMPTPTLHVVPFVRVRRLNNAQALPLDPDSEAVAFHDGPHEAAILPCFHVACRVLSKQVLVMRSEDLF